MKKSNFAASWQLHRAFLEAERRSKLYADVDNSYATVNFSGIEGTWFPRFMRFAKGRLRQG